MARVSNNEIPDLQTDWALDPQEKLPYSGQSVQNFIKKYLNMASFKAECIGFKNMKLYLFASPEDKQEWESTGIENYIDSTELVIVGTERKIQITNKNGDNNMYFTTSQDDALITVTFKSLFKDVLATKYEEDIEDVIFSVSIDPGARGNWQVIDTGTFVGYGNEYSIDVRKYLVTGASRIIIRATGNSSGATGQLNITATLTSMYITPANFTWNIPFIENNIYNLGGVNIGGNLNKILYVRVTNEKGYLKLYNKNLYTEQWVNKAYYFNELEFPEQGTGIYTVELWLESGTVISDKLIYNLMCISESEVGTAQLISTSSIPSKILNYSNNVLFEYVVYDRGNSVATPHVDVVAVVNQNNLKYFSEDLKNVNTSVIIPFELGIEIDSQETNMALIASISIGENLQRAVYPIDNSLAYPATSNYCFYLNPAMRNNTQENREYIVNTASPEYPVNATWTRMAWVDKIDGYTEDDTGRKCLFIPARSKCDIHYAPLEHLDIKTGKTIEFTYKVRNVSDYNEPVISIFSDDDKGGIGIKITPNNVLIFSRDKKAKLTQSLDIQDEVVINCIITIIPNYKVTYGNLCQIAINGVKSRSFEFEIDDSFSNPAHIVLGSNTSDTYIYKILVYEFGFEKGNFQTNMIASLPDSEARKHLYDIINQVCDTNGNIDYNSVQGRYNTMVVEMLNNSELPHHGLSKEYSAWCNVEFSFTDLPDYYRTKVWSFILKNCKIEGQGTTSMNYWLWNLRFRIDKSGSIVVIYPDNTEQIIY